MRTLIISLWFGLMASAASGADSGIVTRGSPYAFGPTLERIESMLAAKGATVFARIDHSAEAKKVGLEMLPATLLVFGNPKAGTPMMIAAPSIAIDLPLKILVSQDKSGGVSVSYASGSFLAARHGLTEEQARPLGAPAAFVEAALR